MKTATTKKNAVKNYTISYGTDPEYMIFDNLTNKIVSAIPVLDERDKYDPIEFNGTKFYGDNILIEHECAPGKTKKEFIFNLRKCLVDIHDWLNKKHGPRYELFAQAAHDFQEEEVEHPAAKAFGCNVSYDAWTVSAKNPPEVTEENKNSRGAGGHFHTFSNHETPVKDEESEFLFNFQSKLDVIRTMDILVGIPFVLVDNDTTNLARKIRYGHSADHRVAGNNLSSGCEYRTMSNYWTRNPEITGLIYDLVENAVSVVESGKHQKLIDSMNIQTIQDTINKSNKNVAAALTKIIGLPKNLYKRVLEHSEIEHDANVFKGWGILTNELVGV